MILINTENLLQWTFLTTEELITVFNRLLLLLEPKKREETTFTDTRNNVIVLAGEFL